MKASIRPALTVMAPALLLSQCAPTPQPQKVAVVDVAPGHWVKVSSSPPTYYPRGLAADVPTDHRSGEWVSTGDDLGTRFFIPFKGISGGERHGLLQEALAYRTEEKRSRIAEEDRIKSGAVVTTAALTPVAITAAAAIAVIAPWWYFRDRWPEGHP